MSLNKPINDDDYEYESESVWSEVRPHVLVVCCSDGRLQEAVDDFLNNALGIADYDRLYAAGGPGALATGGFELMRADVFRKSCQFLLQAHKIETVYLIFHGAAPDGPPESVCAHYRKIMPHSSSTEVNKQQEHDAAEILSYLKSVAPAVKAHVLRAEVHGDRRVRFARL